MKLEMDFPFLLLSFCEHADKAFSTDYEWHGEKRGSDPYVILQWTLSGYGEFCTPQKTHRIGPGFAFLSILPEAASYRYPKESEDPWVFSWMNVVGNFGVSLWRRFREEFGPVNPLPPGSPAGIAAAHLVAERTAGNLQDPYQVSVALFSFYSQWWRQLAGGQVPEVGIARAARQYFDENYASPVNVKELAARAGCSREHFTRLFVREFGTPPATYLRNKRLEAGDKLLREGGWSFHDIARQTGFGSARQFRRACQARESARE